MTSHNQDLFLLIPLGLHKRPNLCSCFLFGVRTKVAVALSHLDGLVADQFANGEQRHSRLGKPGAVSVSERVKNNPVPPVGNAIVEFALGNHPHETLIGISAYLVPRRRALRSENIIYRRLRRSTFQEFANLFCHAYSTTTGFGVLHQNPVGTKIKMLT